MVALVCVGGGAWVLVRCLWGVPTPQWHRIGSPVVSSCGCLWVCAVLWVLGGPAGVVGWVCAGPGCGFFGGLLLRWSVRGGGRFAGWVGGSFRLRVWFQEYRT